MPFGDIGCPGFPSSNTFTPFSLRDTVPGMKSKRRRAAKPPAPEPTAFDRLDPGKQLGVLQELLGRHSSLRVEAEELAREHFAEAGAGEGLAAGLLDELHSLDLDELNERAGTHRGTYVDPGEAGWEACHEILEPYLHDLDAQLDLEYDDAAFETLKGIIAGLYQARNDRGDGCLAWATYFPLNGAEEAIALWVEGPGAGRARKSSETQLHARRARVRALLEIHAPEWLRCRSFQERPPDDKTKA